MHCVEHLAGMNCVHPQIDQIRKNPTNPCIIELVSLTIPLPSLTGARESTEEVQFDLGCRRGLEGAELPHSRAMSRKWLWRGNAEAVLHRAPLSPLTRCPLSHPHHSPQEP